MVLVEGVRVVRGPDWSQGDADGGEGHVGTVTGTCMCSSIGACVRLSVTKYLCICAFDAP